MTSIREKYQKEIIPEMKKEFGLKNVFEVPKIEKVVVNVGIGKFLKDSGQVEDVKKTLEAITGQKPLSTKARKSIAGFKTREGMEVGMKITLRGKRMWDFVEKLVNAALPRVRDFHGLKLKSVDNSGNLNIGIKDQLIFPEILPEEVKNHFSFEVTVVTNTNSKEMGDKLFRLMKFPFESKEK